MRGRYTSRTSSMLVIVQPANLFQRRLVERRWHVFGKLGPVSPTPFHVRTEELSVVRHTQNLVSDQESAYTVTEDRADASPGAPERYSSAYVWNRRVRR